MRWQYTAPAGKLFVSDGKYIYLYTPNDKRYERMPLKETEDMRAPLAFLLGRIHFNEDFREFKACRIRTAIISSSPRPPNRINFPTRK